MESIIATLQANNSTPAWICIGVNCISVQSVRTSYSRERFDQFVRVTGSARRLQVRSLRGPGFFLGHKHGFVYARPCQKQFFSKMKMD